MIDKTNKKTGTFHKEIDICVDITIHVRHHHFMILSDASQRVRGALPGAAGPESAPASGELSCGGGARGAALCDPIRPVG